MLTYIFLSIAIYGIWPSEPTCDLTTKLNESQTWTETVYCKDKP